MGAEMNEKYKSNGYAEQVICGTEQPKTFENINFQIPETHLLSVIIELSNGRVNKQYYSIYMSNITHFNFQQCI